MLSAGRWLAGLAWRLAPPLVFGYFALDLLGHYQRHPDVLWPDAHVYYRATEAWVAGGNPWKATWQGIPFAAPPPALLLSVPLLPFGEGAAVPFWITANAVSLGFLLRRYRLPLYWIAFYPIAEGFTAATPDIALAALVLVGGGSIAALAKPYSVPALLAAERWPALRLAVLLGAASLPVLPWAQFIESRQLVAEAFEDWANPTSAFGHVPLMLATAASLLLLGWRRGADLLTPGLLAQQPHYNVFSLGTISRSRILALAATVPAPFATAIGIIVYALVERRILLRDLVGRATSGRGPA